MARCMFVFSGVVVVVSFNQVTSKRLTTRPFTKNDAYPNFGEDAYPFDELDETLTLCSGCIYHGHTFRLTLCAILL